LFWCREPTPDICADILGTFRVIHVRNFPHNRVCFCAADTVVTLCNVACLVPLHIASLNTTFFLERFHYNLEGNLIAGCHDFYSLKKKETKRRKEKKRKKIISVFIQ